MEREAGEADREDQGQDRSGTQFHYSFTILPSFSPSLTKLVKSDFSQGEKLHLCGDGSFDSRGYSAFWCRYLLLDGETNEVIIVKHINARDCTSSVVMEVSVQSLHSEMFLTRKEYSKISDYRSEGVAAGADLSTGRWTRNRESRD